jgi:hypothetical protein
MVDERKELPIIFNYEMVRAISDGRKTMTRRILKPQPTKPFDAVFFSPLYGWFTGNGLTGETIEKLNTRFDGCDRLWVRETWRQAYPKTSYSDGIVYKADKKKALGMDEYSDRHDWKPSIHMLRKHSRISLRITNMKIERLQDITRGDAMEEGCPFANMADGDDPRHWFSSLWESINGKGAWEADPWVVAISFKQIP